MIPFFFVLPKSPLKLSRNFVCSLHNNCPILLEKAFDFLFLKNVHPSKESYLYLVLSESPFQRLAQVFEDGGYLAGREILATILVA